MYNKQNPINIYPHTPNNFTFGHNNIILKRNFNNLQKDDEVELHNISRYGGEHSYALYDGENYININPQTFIKGIDFDWA